MQSSRSAVAHATGWGLFVASLVLASIYFGRRRLRAFDAALVPYASASVSGPLWALREPALT